MRETLGIKRCQARPGETELRAWGWGGLEKLQSWGPRGWVTGKGEGGTRAAFNYHVSSRNTESTDIYSVPNSVLGAEDTNMTQKRFGLQRSYM